MGGRRGRFKLAGSTDDYSLDLLLSSTKPAVAHGNNGVIPFGVDGELFYYSYPRLAITGRVTDHGVEAPVTGDAWMDHQWGDFDATEFGWDWFSLQLDDGTEVMFFNVETDDGESVARLGTYVGTEGSSWPLEGDDVVVRPTGTWDSPHTDASYPHGWEIEVRSLRLVLNLTPVLEDSEFLAQRPEIPTYWEGEVVIEGTRKGEPIGGLGFVELVGYDRR